MAVYFALTRKGDKQKLPFLLVDDEIREALKAGPNPLEYYLNWYGIVGFKLALGHTFTKIRENVDEELLPVIEFIENNYDSHSSSH